MVRILPLILAALALISLGSKDASAQQYLLGELYGMGVHAYNSQDYETAYEYLTSAIDQSDIDAWLLSTIGRHIIELHGHIQAGQVTRGTSAGIRDAPK